MKKSKKMVYVLYNFDHEGDYVRSRIVEKSFSKKSNFKKKLQELDWRREGKLIGEIETIKIIDEIPEKEIQDIIIRSQNRIKVAEENLMRVRKEALKEISFWKNYKN